MGWWTFSSAGRTVAGWLGLVPRKDFDAAQEEARAANARLENLIQALREEFRDVRRSEHEGNRSDWVRSRHDVLDKLLEAVRREVHPHDTPFGPNH